MADLFDRYAAWAWIIVLSAGIWLTPGGPVYPTVKLLAIASIPIAVYGLVRQRQKA